MFRAWGRGCEPLNAPDRNVAIVRRGFEALARDDFEAALADHDPSTQWRTAADEPDFRVYRGVEGLRQLIASLAERVGEPIRRFVRFEDARRS